MSLIHVNTDKCVKCGLCSEVCPTAVIEMSPSGPVDPGKHFCIVCGHCVAVCPTEALDHKKTPLAGQVKIKKELAVTEEQAAQFLRTRRSIRCYKPDLVKKEEILKILDMARLASTGSNAQGLSYLVISGRDKMEQISAAVLEWMKEEIEKKTPWSKYFMGTVRTAEETGRDMILRGAPQIIVAMTKKGFGQGQENAHFSLAYAELFAPTLGIGTCWAGFLQFCAFSGHEPLLKLLNLPEGKEVAGVLMLGYPKYRYQRLVDRHPLKVEWHD